MYLLLRIIGKNEFIITHYCDTGRGVADSIHTACQSELIVMFTIGAFLSGCLAM